MIIKRLYSTVNNKYDIIIVGGGMVGSVLAKVLASTPCLSNHSILLLEGGKKNSWENNSNYSNRVSAINFNSKQLLQYASLWDTICSVRCKPVHLMKVWGNSSNKLVTIFDSQNHSVAGEALTYIIENDLIISSAFDSLNEYDERVQVLYESSVKDFALPNDNNENVHITLNDGSSLSCSLLLGADGINSAVRKNMHVQYLSWNYNQRAVVATVELNESSENVTAWQKFISTGPIALLPLTDNLSSLVWSTTPEHSKHLLSLSDECFVDELNSSLWQVPISNTIVSGVSAIIDKGLETLCLSSSEEYGEIIPPTINTISSGSRASFPLGFGHAVEYVRPRVALIGDAAHRVHPLAGQGVNIGFGDVKTIADLLAKTISYGGTIGDYDTLWRYQNTSLKSNIPKLLGIDLIQKIAGNTWTPLLLLNHTAYQISVAIPPVKKFLINQAAA